MAVGRGKRGIGDRFQRLSDGLWVWAEGEVESDPGFLAMSNQKDGEAVYLEWKPCREVREAAENFPGPWLG